MKWIYIVTTGKCFYPCASKADAEYFKNTLLKDGKAHIVLRPVYKKEG